MSATFFNVLMAGRFTGLMVFLLVFTLTYALLDKSKVLPSKNLNAIIALAAAFLSLANPNIVKLIASLTPWFFIILLIVFFILLGLLSMGLDYKVVTKSMSKWGPFHSIFIGFVGFVILLVFAQVYGSHFNAVATGNTTATTGIAHTLKAGITHTIKALIQPQILALMFVFLTAASAIFFLTSSPVSTSK